jgi:thymidylate synthase ThyX
MIIKGIGICPPPSASDNPSVTPELLASCLARYSRSNKGIDSILGSIDWKDPDKSVDSIFRFVDYGHASITGMTGGIAIVVDGCSMFLAYKIFELAQLCDGQESSTRYIKLDRSNLGKPAELGIAPQLENDWSELMDLSFEIYHELYESLDRKAQADPSVVRLPQGADKKVGERLRKNYALDRARYFIPFATRTNAAYVMTARVWTEVIRNLDSLPVPEAQACAAGLRAELSKFVPRMIKHSVPDDASKAQAKSILDYSVSVMRSEGIKTEKLKDEVYLSVEDSVPSFLPRIQSFQASFTDKRNRYSAIGSTVKRIFVRCAWNNMAIAELRDLNRHRSGYRLSPLTPVGFYLPPQIDHPRRNELLDKQKRFLEKAVSNDNWASSYFYGLLLGTQVPFEHSTHADKFIYEIELRTGMGAHFRYAEHLSGAYDQLVKKIPELKNHIVLGTCEPE